MQLFRPIIQCYLPLLISALLLNLPIQAISQDGSGSSRISSFNDVVFMKPTGDSISNLPKMVMLSDTTQLSKSVGELFENTFVHDSLDKQISCG